MSEPDPLQKLNATVAQTRQALAGLRDAAALASLAMQDLAMVIDDDLAESLDDAARCLITRSSGS